uniref:Uncharacterized protein n=1 Tax=Arundo donax TaxID=35708 RepID=A0A0A9BE73_ARUDO
MIFSNVDFKDSLVQDISCIMCVSTHYVNLPFCTVALSNVPKINMPLAHNWKRY